MKKHLKFFLLLAALMVPWAANAQTDSLTTCRGTMTSVSHAPFFVYWTDLIYRTEYLVPADSLEDMSGSSITGMTFHMNNTSFSLANMGPFKVMMSETSAASLNSSVWNTDTSSNLVYSGTLSVSNGVLHVELDEPYTYGGDNLIVSFYVPASGGVYGSASNYWIGCSSSTSVLGASREQVATGPGTNVTGYYLPQCTFSYTTGSTFICRTVRNLAADDVLADEATLSWNTRNGESAWVVYLNGEELETVYDSTYTLTNLSANTSYTFGVRAVCSAGDTSNMASTNIRTPCTLLTSSDLPLVETFDSWTTGQSSPIDQCWSRHNTYSSTSNYPYTYSSTHRGATGNSLYCYTSSTTHNTIVLPAVDDLNGLMLSFWTYTSSSANSRFQVGTMTDPTDASTFTAFYTTPSDPASSTWVENEALVPANTTAHYLAIRTLNSGYVTSYIDDVTLMEAPSCFHASGVSVSGITTDEATLTVDDPTEAGNYTYYLYVNNAVVDSGYFSTDTYTLTNLDANTGYAVSVVTNCSDGTRTAAVSTTFRTTCDVISTLPWTENFDSYSDLYTSYPSRMTAPMVPCWDFLEASSSGYMFLSAANNNYNYGGTGYTLGFYPGTVGAQNIIVLPPFDDDISGLEISLQTRPEGTSASSGSFDIGYMTDAADATTFVSTEHFNYSDFSDSYQLVSATFAGAPSGARIAMRHTSAATNYYWFVDDIDVHVAPSCTRPSITLSDLTATGITVNLADANDVNHYMLWWGSDSTEVTGTSYALTDLTAATTYTLTAVTLCGDGTRTASVSVTFTTPCEAIATLPWSDGFESYSTGAAPSCYTHLTPGTSSVNFLQVYNYTTHTGSNCLRFNYSTPSGNVLALPLFDAEINTLELSLWLRPESYSNSSCGTFEIGYLTDASSASSFVALSTIAYNDFTSTDYREEVVAFIGAPEGARMALRQKGTTTNWYWHVDDIDVHEAPSCLRPNGVAVSGIGSTEAHVTIADSSYAGNYRIDFVNGSDTLTVTVYDTAYNATNLSASTGYTVYVRTICSDGTLTTAVTTSFRTECDVISTLPWHETFQSFTAESGAGQASSITNLPCWTIHQSYSYYSFIQNSWNHEEGGANAIRIYGGDSYPTYMVLPPFDEDLENLMFSFWSNFDNSTLHMVMGYMTDADQTSTFVPLDTIWAPTEADRNRWVYNEVLFPTGAEGRIAYRFYGSGTSNVRLDDYTVMLAPSCVRPQSVSVDSVTTTTADITIVDPTNNGNYQYTLMMGSTVVDSGIVSSTAISLTGLNPSTTYIINVYSICSDGNLTMPNSATFTTECAAITTLPWTEGFEGYAVTSSQVNIPCWNNVRPSTSAYVCITDASTRVHSGSRSMRFSGYAATPNMMVLPEFADNISGLEMSFWSVAEGSNSGWLRVGYVTDPTDTTTFVQMDAFYETQTTYTQQFVTFAGAPAGARIAIQQRTPGSNNMWWWIDDIDVHVAPSCTRPVVSVTNVTAYSADVNLVDANGVNSYVLITATDTLTVGNSYTLTGLTPITTYTLSAATLCSDGDTTTFATASFTTPCAMLSASADMPLTQDFEGLPSSAAIDIPCWTRIGRGTSYPSWPHTTSATGPNGTGNMVCYFYSDANANEYLITPPIDTLSNLMVSFYMRQISSGVGITVGVMADPNVDSTFVPIQTFVPTVSGTWELCEVPLAGHDNDGHYVAFRIRPATSGGVYMDNVVIDQMPSCMHPVGVTASNVTTSSAHIVVDDPTYVGSYRMTLTSTVDTVVVNLTDTAYDATGLANSTLYTVTVAAVCDDDSLTSSVTTTFTTLCDAISTLPWHEDFNSYGSYYTSYASRMTVDMIPCWDFIGSNSGAYMFLTDASNSYGYDATSGYSLSFYPGQSGRRNYVVLPPFSSDISTLEMSCWTRPEGTSASSGSFDFGYMTDGNDTTTFVVLQHYNYSDFSNAYGEVTLTFAGAPAGSRIAMRHNTAASNYYWYVDEIDVHQAPSCTRPSVTIDSVDAHSVTVRFADPNNVGSYLVNLGGTSTVVNDTLHTFTGLHAGTSYTLEAATLCPGGDTTSFATVSFYTSCEILTRADLPMVETFDNYAPASSADINPCWGRYNYYNSSVYPYPYSYYHYGTGGNSMYFYPGLANAAQYLVLPAYDTVANTNINFWVYRTTTYPVIEVGVMSDPTDTTTFTAVQVCTPAALSTWTEFDIDLDSYADTGHYVALRAYCNTYSGYAIYVDQVTLSPISTCPRPTSVAVSNITETSADVTITDPANSGHYRLWWSDGTMVDSTDTYATTYSLSGLIASSTYSLQVSSICADGSLTHRTSTTFRTQCGAIASSALPWLESFENFANNTRDTAVDFSCWTFIHPHGDSSYSSNGYCQVTNSYAVTGGNTMRFSGYASTPMVAILPEFADNVSDLSMTFYLRAENSNAYSGTTTSPGAIRVGYITDITDSSTFVQTARFECTSGNYGTMHLDSATFTGAPAGARIAIEQVNNNTNYWWWIDDITVSNTNGTAYYTVSATSANTAMGTASVTPSGSVEEGTSVTATATANDGFQFVNWTVGGSVVSTANPYTFSVTANTALVANFDVDATCEVPTDVTASDVTLSSATIGWTADEGQSQWEIHVTGTNYDETFTANTNPYTVTGLVASVTYTVTVRALCDAEHTSDWSAPATFTTTTCQPVSGVHTDATASGATVTWTAPAGVNSFEIEYGPSGFNRGAGTSVTVNGTRYDITGLAANNVYDVYVRSICAEGIYSAWSNAETFTTPDNGGPQGIDDVNNASIALYPNPATTTVTLSGIDGQAVVTIVDMNGRVTGEYTANGADLTIDLTGYAQGAYFVRITGEQQNAIRKLIVK